MFERLKIKNKQLKRKLLRKQSEMALKQLKTQRDMGYMSKKKADRLIAELEDSMKLEEDQHEAENSGLDQQKTT